MKAVCVVWEVLLRCNLWSVRLLTASSTTSSAGPPSLSCLHLSLLFWSIYSPTARIFNAPFITCRRACLFLLPSTGRASTLNTYSSAGDLQEKSGSGSAAQHVLPIEEESFHFSRFNHCGFSWRSGEKIQISIGQWVSQWMDVGIASN